MSEEMLVRHCSPTLAGMKTGNMFVCSYNSIDEMRASLRYWNRALGKKGLRFLPLRFNDNKALIYVYRPSKLSLDLKNELAHSLLHKRGYNTATPERCLVHLMKKLNEESDFPHEIGLFLGYPPCDVCGFIENKAKGFKLVGCWKVYGDEHEAKRTFEKYKKCSDVYLNQYLKGKSIERLTVVG